MILVPPLSHGPLERRRSVAISAVLVAATFFPAVAVFAQSLPGTQTVCGRVVQITCDDDRKVGLIISDTPFAEGGVTVSIASEETLEQLLEGARELLLRDVCVEGRLVRGALTVDRLPLPRPDRPPPRIRSTGIEEAAYPCEPGVQLPVPLREVRPHYTREALSRGIEGSALIEAVVGRTGVVESARLLRSVDTRYGLDKEALRTARQWRFQPATRDGVAVPVVVTIELHFTIEKRTR